MITWTTVEERIVWTATADPSYQFVTLRPTSVTLESGGGGGGAVDSVNGETGVVVLDAADVGAVDVALVGAADGVAELDSGGLVPSSQLPSYVDDVIEAANFAALPGTGETGKIYVTLDNNLTFRWSGSAYVEISASLALGETSSTAYRGDRGKTAYDHSQVTTGNPHGTTAADVGAQAADADLTTIAGLTPTTDSFMQAKAGAWAARTIAQVKTDLGVPLNYVAPRVTGEWYSTRGPVATAVLGGTNATTGRIQCIPVYLHAGTIDRIGVYTTSAGSGTTWRLGIYPSGTDGLPDGQARLIDAGTVDMGATAGLLAITISQSIATAGLYWLVCLSDAYSANPTVYAWNAQSMPIQELEGIPTFFASNSERSGWMRTATGVTTGSIPSTCPTLAWGNSGPKIAVRAA